MRSVRSVRTVRRIVRIRRRERRGRRAKGTDGLVGASRAHVDRRVLLVREVDELDLGRGNPARAAFPPFWLVIAPVNPSWIGHRVVARRVVGIVVSPQRLAVGCRDIAHGRLDVDRKCGRVNGGQRLRRPGSYRHGISHHVGDFSVAIRVASRRSGRHRVVC